MYFMFFNASVHSISSGFDGFYKDSHVITVCADTRLLLNILFTNRPIMKKIVENLATKRRSCLENQTVG